MNYRDISPTLFDRTPQGTITWDIYSKLFESRIIMVAAPIDPAIAVSTIAQILTLSQKDDGETINIYLNSPGGDYESVVAVYDTMKFVPNKIIVTCIGEVKGVAALILAGGEERVALPHARITLSSPQDAGERGQASDVALRAQMLEMRQETFIRIMSSEVGRTVDEVRNDIHRDTHLFAEQAIKYGIIDMVAPPRKKTRHGEPDDTAITDGK